MTDEYRELNLVLEFLDAIDTTELSEENAGNVIEAHGYLSMWLEENTKPPQQFEVGEYYVDDAYIYKIKQVIPKSLLVDCLKIRNRKFKEASWSMCRTPPPVKATVEQIAEFKLAEYLNDVSDADKERMIQMLSESKMPLGAWMSLHEKTAEELEGV